MTRNALYLCSAHGQFWRSYTSSTPTTKGKAPTHARCPSCPVECPRVHPAKPAIGGAR